MNDEIKIAIVEDFKYIGSDEKGRYFQGLDINGNKIVGEQKKGKEEIVWKLEK